MVSFISSSPIITSYIVFSVFNLSIPSPLDKFPCGSKSIAKTLCPASAKAAERLTAVVVLPTPPF